MASMLEAIEIKRKTYFEYEGAPYHCLDVEVSKPTARGGQTLVRIKMRNMLTQAVIRRAFVFEIGLSLDLNRFEHAGHDQYCMRPAAQTAFSAKTPSLSPKCSRSSRPSARRTPSITFASGVPLGAFRCSPPGNAPPPRPAMKNGTRLWL